VGEPSSGHETEEESVDGPPAGAAGGLAGAGDGSPVLVVGAGPAGLECARVLALRGRRVRVAERAARTGGGPRVAFRRFWALLDWLEAECRDLGVAIDLRTEVTEIEGEAVLATGSRPRNGRLDALAV